MKKVMASIKGWFFNNKLIIIWGFAFMYITGLQPLLFPPPNTKPAVFMDYISLAWEVFSGVILLILFRSFLRKQWLRIKKLFSDSSPTE